MKVKKRRTAVCNISLSNENNIKKKKKEEEEGKWRISISEKAAVYVDRKELELCRRRHSILYSVNEIYI